MITFHCTIYSSLNSWRYFSFQSKNKVSLRNLSMVLRQLSGPPVEKVKLIEESIERAKEAVQLDIADGTSWCE